MFEEKNMCHKFESYSKCHSDRPSRGLKLHKFASRSGLSFISGSMKGTTGVVWRKQKPEADRREFGPVPLVPPKNATRSVLGLNRADGTPKSDCLNTSSFNASQPSSCLKRPFLRQLHCNVRYHDFKSFEKLDY